MIIPDGSRLWTVRLPEKQATSHASDANSRFTSVSRYSPYQAVVADEENRRLVRFNFAINQFDGMMELPFRPYHVEVLPSKMLLVYSRQQKVGARLAWGALQPDAIFVCPSDLDLKGMTSAPQVGCFGVSQSGKIVSWMENGGFPVNVSATAVNSGAYAGVPTLMPDGYFYVTTRDGSPTRGTNFSRFKPTLTPNWDNGYDAHTPGWRFGEATTVLSESSLLYTANEPVHGGTYILEYDLVSRAFGAFSAYRPTDTWSPLFFDIVSLANRGLRIAVELEAVQAANQMESIEVSVKRLDGSALFQGTANLGPTGYIDLNLAEELPQSGVQIWLKGRLWLAAKTLWQPEMAEPRLNLLTGDINGDNAVNTDDYLALSAYFEKTSANADWNQVGAYGVKPSDTDLNFDKTVGTDDYILLSKNFDTAGADRP